ncbi:phenylalanine--tRNA ligase subunit beta [Listeria monocytogenes]|nr:phenylalanine--tRNA ligase subunit beta [Listeria monocytogenes]EKZ3944793.1 phenylalanine--tRNA ligase subunit beta [Listeria monocytogenes]EKZ3953273.1 phenylalanine--tRNA ligase subunit beta [Listeria monocytogenes]
MLVSYNWVKEFFQDFPLTAEELGEAITRTGIEIEGVEELSASLKNVVVGEVLSCERHPDAEKLNKCLVQTDETEPVQIICGAPNVAAGQKVIVAKVGARLPGGLKIKRAKLRGEVSEGMICSLAELGFESKVVPKAYAEGIYVLPAHVETGVSAITLLGLDDAILDMAITPNRADALSMNGVAHEVGAIIHQKPAQPTEPDVSEKGKADDFISVEVENPAETPYYAIKMVENIEIKESPLWLQTKLMKAGIRPHNNVVDVTNYINLLYGQPLHSFDYDKIGSKKIVVRSAKEQEEITTLDGEKRTLQAGHTVITNGVEPIAIAGVMGGEFSEVTENTTTVALEGAIFSSSSIGKASRELYLRTEASIRYDKGSDAWKVEKALAHGGALIAELSGGTLVGGVVEVDNREKAVNKIETSLTRINRILGTAITLAEIETIFDRLGFVLEVKNDALIIEVPTRRWDITIEADILEEVARIYSYDEIPVTLPATSTTGGLSDSQKARRVMRAYLEGAGLNQALTYSLTSKKDATRLALSDEKTVALSMPMSEEHSHLRTSIVPQLIRSASYNIARKNMDVALYEMGTVFYATEGDNLPIEQEHLAGLITGNWHTVDWQKTPKPVDFFVLKGIVEGLVNKLGIKSELHWKQTEKEELHPGRTASLILEGQEIGYLGALHPAVEANYDLKETYVFEINVAALLDATKEKVVYHPIPRYPEMTRDLALLVDKNTDHATISQVIQEHGGKLLVDIELFDIFEGESLGENKKSLAYTLTFLDSERTLVEEDVQKATNKVIEALQEKLHAIIR